MEAGRAEMFKNVDDICGSGHPKSDIWILGYKVMSIYGGMSGFWGIKYTYLANNTTNAHKSAFSMYWIYAECPRTVFCAYLPSRALQDPGA